MSEPNAALPPRDDVIPDQPGEALQFDQAEFTTPVSDRPACAVCKQPIADEYYELGGKTVCAQCRQGVEAAFRGGSPMARVLRALILGTAAAAVGAVIYYAIVRATGYNLSLVSILVGFMVGGAVRRGSGNRGGPFYQALAILLTYMAIVAMNVFPLFELVGFDKARAVLLAGIGHVLTAPVFEAFEAPIAGLIYAFALWEAWRINRGVVLTFNGPFRLGAKGPGAPAPEVGIDGG
jgi:hypothetical protein